MTNPFATAGMAAGYAAARPPVHPRVLASYFATGVRSRATRVLDLGCGAGLSTRALEPFAECTVGVDPAVAMVQHVRELAPHARCAAASGEALPFSDASFDLVTAAGSLNYVRDLARCYRELRRVLRQDGRVLVYDFSAGRRFADGPALAEWFAAFLDRWPYPASEARPLDPDTLGTSVPGFAVARSERFAVPLPLSRKAYEDYVLTETNVASALRRRGALEDIRTWVHASLAEIWDEDAERPVVFTGYWAELVSR